MSYLDPPEENAPTFCPVCLTDDWVDVNEEYNAFVNTYYGLLAHTVGVEEKICCSNCGLSLDYLNVHVELYHKLAEPEPDDYVLTPEEIAEMEDARQSADIERLIEAGLLTEDGEPTDAYYRESDFQYDCWRDRR